MNVLVCITPQSNSRRLIDKGAEVVDNGKLHILHMQRGDNIFSHADAGNLLEELFNYGKTKGGTVHFVSGDHFFETLKVFVVEKNIDSIVVGEPPSDIMPPSDLVKIINQYMPDILPIVVQRLAESL